MFARDLHLALALATVAVMLVVATEGAVRLVSARPPGRVAAASANVLLVLVLMAAAGGLALLAGGHRPRELLHGMYALLALGMVPVADSLAARAAPRRRALATFLGAAISLVVLVRLFNTG